MKNSDFNIYDDDDPMCRAYREFIWENDALDREPIFTGRNILLLPHDRIIEDDTGRTAIRIDSRHAFGDGRHPTTILCLNLLEEYLDGLSGADKKSIVMLDMGTGTGVLSILASLMGLENILALDIDPDAVTNARDMADLNGCRSIDFRVMDAAELPPVPAYGLITANLLPPVLRFIIPLTARLALPGAPVIFSGIGDASCGGMERLMADSGFCEIKRVTSGWWHAYLARK